MAVLELNALSTALAGSFSATVIFPDGTGIAQDRLYPALYFLHDIGGNDTDIRTIKNLQDLSNELGLFIISPSLMHSFGIDLRWGGKYGDFVCRELPGICRHMFPLDESRQYAGGTGGGAYGVVDLPGLPLLEGALQAQIDALTDRRKELYSQRREGLNVEAEIAAINGELRQLRRELKTCGRIGADIPRIRQQVRLCREQEAPAPEKDRRIKKFERK